MSALAVALGAGVGAALRWLVSSWLDRLGFHWGTWAVNLTGSFVLGTLVGAGVGGQTMLLLGTGFCGGLTTYSSFVVQTNGRGPLKGAAYAVVTLVPALGAAALGYWLAGGAQA